LLFSCYVPPPDLHSFPTRRSSDLLHLLQPLARLWSRLAYSLTARKIRRFPTLSFPWPRMFQFWSEEWVDATELLLSLESVLRSRSEEHTSELQSRGHLVCRLLLEK